MEFQRLVRQNMAEKIIASVRGQIESNALEPGAQLPSEEKLAAQMGVSRGTVREALSVLVYLGFIERRGNATHVAAPRASQKASEELVRIVHRYQEYMGIIEARRVIEPELAALAAVRGSPEQVTEIEECYALMASHRGDTESFIEDDNRFHNAVFAAAGNGLLQEFMKSIHAVIRENQAQVIRNSDIAPRSLEYHGAIAEAIRDGNADLARARMLTHICDIQKEMRELFRQQRGE